jgi:hypothetical protein
MGGASIVLVGPLPPGLTVVTGVYVALPVLLLFAPMLAKARPMGRSAVQTFNFMTDTGNIKEKTVSM